MDDYYAPIVVRSLDKGMRWSFNKPLVLLWLFFTIATGYSLQNLPGLLGDEGDEGQKVYNILHGHPLTITGERSYIGPLIDYARIPFVFVFGYTTLALRALVFVCSQTTFWLLVYILKRFLGEAMYIPLVLVLFSPVFLLETRIGWAISLNVFFLTLLVATIISSLRYRALLAGLVGGVALSNHLVFLPTLVAVVCIAGISQLRQPKRLLTWWPAVVGFAAGFGTQFAVLLLNTDDQGSSTAIAQTFMQRWQDLPSLLPLLFSSSSFIARYTGVELAPLTISIMSWGSAVLVGIGLLFSKHKKIAWLVLLGLLIHLAVLLRIVDRYALRYFVVFALTWWFLVGLGIEVGVAFIRQRWPQLATWLPVALAVILLVFTTITVVIPFNATGGSTNNFSLGNRTDSASALVDVRGLLDCVHNIGPLWSENVHVYNRLLFFSRQYPDIQVLDEDHKNQAAYLVDYRIPTKPNQSGLGDICPELTHFRIVKR